MDLKEVIALRRTCRRYQEKQISESQLQQILLAAQTAPLATGDDKTTHLTIIQDSTVLDAIRKCCMMSTKKGSPVDPFYGAPTVIFVSATDISSDHIEYSNAACIIENMILAATNEKLGSTYIWGCLRKLRKSEETMKLLKLPDGYEILSALAVGYPVEPLEPREATERIAVTRI